MSCSRVELERGERHLLVVDGDTPAGGVDGERTAVDRNLRGRRLHAFPPPEDGLDPYRQLSQAERLGQVVVGADREPRHLVGLLRPRGQHQHRDPLVLLDLLAHLEPVHAGEHEIEDDEIGAFLECRTDALRAVTRHHGLESLRDQPGPDGLGDGLLVLHHEHLAVDHEDPS
jgi:hypothetical protein